MTKDTFDVFLEPKNLVLGLDFLQLIGFTLTKAFLE